MDGNQGVKCMNDVDDLKLEALEERVEFGFCDSFWGEVYRYFGGTCEGL